MSATAVVVPVERAERAVLRWRREHTRDGAEGMPAHVTLLYPFVDNDQLVAAQVTGLREVLAKLHPFEVRFATFGQFDGPPRVLYLEPTPAQPLIHATRAIAQRFPDYPPFGGVFESVVPHLTVAQTGEAEVLEAAEADVATHLPIAARVTEVLVMHHHERDGWRMRNRIAL